jgi:hypothetical protein
MSEGSVTRQNINHKLTVKVGGQLEVCGISA